MELNRDKTNENGTVVRVGQHAWVVGHTQKVTEDKGLASGDPLMVVRSPKRSLIDAAIAGVPEPSDTSSGHLPIKPLKKLKDSFQTGIIIGLVLGCLSLFLFHQMQPSYSKLNPSAEFTTTVAGLETAGAPVTLPSIHLYAVTLDKSRATLNQLKTHNLQFVDDSNTPYIIYELAATKVGAARIETQLKKLGFTPNLRDVSAPVHKISTLPGVTPSLSEQSSHWMSAADSALTTVVAMLADGVPTEDATAAAQFAKRAYPGDAVVAPTGLGHQVYALNLALNTLYMVLQSGNREKLRLATVRVFNEWMQLQSVQL